VAHTSHNNGFTQGARQAGSTKLVFRGKAEASAPHPFAGWQAPPGETGSVGPAQGRREAGAVSRHGGK